MQLAFQNNFGSRFRADQARQSGCAAPGRNESERRLGQSDPRRRIIGGDAIIAGERDLIATAGTCSVNRSDGGNLERGKAIENALAFRDKGAHFAGRRLAQQCLQISARR